MLGISAPTENNPPLEGRLSWKESVATESTAIIGDHESMQRAKHRVEQAEDLRILFYGETGTGKTPFARYSNERLGRYRPRPFEQVNSACLTPEHFQDIMFGHKRGAFTGAISDKRGLVELARGGDLFLDEIGDMPLEVQAHLLTFLDTQEYYPLGDDKKRRAEVRILCATNKNLPQMIQEGKFRRDLYSRLSQVVIELAPLRERKSDLPLLVEHFIRRFVGHKPCEGELMRLLGQHAWREGNVRELRDVVEFACRVSKNDRAVGVKHLPERYRVVDTSVPGKSADHHSLIGAEEALRLADLGLEQYLGAIERQILSNYLTETDESLEAMAKALRVSRPTLYRRLRKYSLLRSTRG